MAFSAGPRQRVRPQDEPGAAGLRAGAAPGQLNWQRPAGASGEPRAPAEAIEPEARPSLAAAPASLPARASVDAMATDEAEGDLPDELRLVTARASGASGPGKRIYPPGAMRVNLHVRRTGADGSGDGGIDGAATASAPGYHMDTLDLYAARARAAFLRH